MGATTPIGSPNAGIVITQKNVRLVAHEAITAGDVFAVAAEVQTVNGVTVPQLYKTADIADGTETSNSDSGLIVVALEDVASGDEGIFCLQGMVDVQHDTTVAVGAALAAKTGAETLTAAVAGTKVVAYAVEARTGAGVAKVMFDGLNGLGIFVA